MSPVRYPSFAHRKQAFKRTEAELNRTVREAKEPQMTSPRPVEITYAENLLPTLPGLLHGIVGTDPWRIQCDGCGAVEEPHPLVIARTLFQPGSGDPRRLCPDCQKEAGW